MSWKFFGSTFFTKKVVKKSNGAAFLGLSQALGMMAGGLAMWGGAKLDELTNNQLGKSKSSSEKDLSDYIIDKAKSNVGLPTLNEVKSSGKQLGVNYSKGYRKPNMKRAEDMFERLDKKRRDGLGAGARAGMATSIFIRGMTSNLDDILTLKKLGKDIDGVIGDEKNTEGVYPYNVMSANKKQQKEAVKLIDHGLESLLEQLQGVTLSSEGGSMNEAARSNAYNNTNNTFSKGKSKDTENLDSPFRSINGYSNNYMEKVEKLNRNNIQRISKGYMDFKNTEEMIRASIEKYNRRNGR